MNKESRLIGVCLSTIHQEDRFFFISALNKSACENGYRLLIFNTRNDLYTKLLTYDLNEAAIFKLIPYEKLTALLVFPAFLDDGEIVQDIINSAHKADVPVFTVDRDYEGCTSFKFSYSEIFSDISRHVIEHHHARKVFMLGGPENSSFSNDRIASFVAVAKENGLTENDYAIGHGDFWEGPAIEQMKRWLDEEKRPVPDAIVCANDSMAIAVSTFLQERGVRIPHDCIITGFDGTIQSNHHIPQLTTCKEDFDAMGKCIIDAVNTVRNGGKLEPEYHVGVKMRISESCGCKRLDSMSVNVNAQNLLNQLAVSFNRQDCICETLNIVSSMDSLDELTHKMADIFAFYSVVIAINSDMFTAPDFGNFHKGDNAFSKDVDIVINRHQWVWKDKKTIPAKNLLPDTDIIFERELPVLFVVLHQADLTLGYCAFQPEMNIDEYQKIHAFASAASSAFGMFHDRTQIESINLRLTNVNRELERLYIHDHLTNLLNRRGFFLEFNRMVEEKKGKGDFDIVMISADLDGLKIINDNYGHSEGDFAITTAARALVESSFHDEICARFGGDEYEVCAIVPSSEVRMYEASYRDSVMQRLTHFNQMSGKCYSVEMSIGFANISIDKFIDYDELVKLADDEMYADKVARKKNRR